MRPDLSYPGKSGDVAVHRSGDAVILWHRKSGSDATPHPGWWLLGRTDGLADFVLEGPDWVLIDGKELFALLQIARAAVAGGDDPVSANSAIEWTDASWNIVTGCDRVSPGCDRCYIERTPPFRIEGRRFDADGRMGIRLHPDRLDWPKRWSDPKLVFTPSLGDLFHADVPDAFIVDVFAVMAIVHRHTYQVLTKRPQRMARWAADAYTHSLVNVAISKHLGVNPSEHGPYRTSQDAMRLGQVIGDARRNAGLPPFQPWPLANVWLGTSIESDRYAFRAHHLRATPAAVRWLSLEPLLGPLPSLDLTGIDWVVVGGESGSGARPMDLDWARDIRDRCEATGTRFFVKQLGAVLSRERGMSSKAGHDIDEFPEDLRIREYPEATGG